MKRLGIVLSLLLSGGMLFAVASEQPSKAAVFFHRTAERVDNFLLRGLDSNYIALPEFRWRVAQTNCETGLSSVYTTWVDPGTPVSLASHSTPSVELGFNAAYCNFGFGYSWDVMNAYSARWNISLGSKRVGVEFLRNVTTNMEGRILVNGVAEASNYPPIRKGEWQMAFTSLSAWYALNAAHYSHNAAIKQSYLQKRTAGSLLLSVAYMSSQMTILDSLKYLKDETMSTLVDGVKGMITRQVSVGIGYGINYTPNRGKVLCMPRRTCRWCAIPSIISHMPFRPVSVLRPSRNTCCIPRHQCI